MSLPESFGFAAMLVGLVVFGTKIGVECEPIDVLTLIALAVSVGVMVHKL